MKYFLRFSFSGVFFFILLSSFFFVGCISDDYDDCPTGVFLRFTYEHNSSYVDLLSDQVNDLSVYIYSSDGAYVSHRRVPCSELVDNRFYLSLPSGDYHLVFWGNQDESYYSCNATSSRSDFRLHAISDADGFISSLGSLFHGSLDISVKEYTNISYGVSLVKNTNLVRVILRGNNLTRSSVDASSLSYGVGISGSNGVYDSDNTGMAIAPVYYIPQYDLSDFAIEASFTLLRLFENDDLNLSIFRSHDGSSLYDLRLVDELMKHPDVNSNDDLDRFDDYTLVYDVSDTYAVSLISVNDWEVNSIGGGL